MPSDERTPVGASSSTTHDADTQVTETTVTTTSFAISDDDESSEAAAVQSGTPATLRATTGLLVYLVVLVIFAMYSLISFWPRPTPNEQIPPARVDSASRSTPSPATAPARDSQVIGANRPTAAAPPAAEDAPVRAGVAAPMLVAFQAAPTSDAPNATTRASLADPCGATRLDELLWTRRAAGESARPSLDSLRSHMVAVCYFGRPRVIWKETQLVLLVIVAGMLGGLLHALYKTTSNFFTSQLVLEGLLGLYTWPLSGAIVGLIFYVLVRGGFFSSQASVEQTSPYSFVALALLGGMFPHKANEKLTQIADLMLTAAKKDKAAGGAQPTPTPAGAPVPASTARAQNERGDIPAPPAGASVGGIDDAQG